MVGFRNACFSWYLLRYLASVSMAVFRGNSSSSAVDDFLLQETEWSARAAMSSLRELKSDERHMAHEFLESLRREALFRIAQAALNRHDNISEAPYESMRTATLARLDVMERDLAVLLTRRSLEAREGALEEAAKVVDQCNREGPYNAICSAERIRALSKEGHGGPHQLELPTPPLKKLAIAIAGELLVLDFIREQDISGVIFAIEKKLERQAAGEGPRIPRCLERNEETEPSDV